MQIHVKFKFLIVYPAATRAFSWLIISKVITFSLISVRLLIKNTGEVNWISTTPHASI